MSGPCIKCGALVPVVVLGLLAAAEGYRVLVVFPLPGRSHGHLGEGYVRALLNKGHEVTHITPYPLTTRANLTTIDISSYLEILSNDQINFHNLQSGVLNKRDPKNMFGYTQAVARQMLGHENVRKLLNDPNERFDVVVAEWVWSELYAGLAALFRCPLIWSSSMDVHSMILRLVDDFPNPAYTTDILGARTPPFNFLQRAEELWKSIEMAYYSHAFYPKAEADYADVFAAPAKQRGVTLPPYEEAIYNGSMILANSHPSIGDTPRLPQNVKNIGGYHIDLKIKPLPSNLQKIMDEAEHGVIYFSLGSIMNLDDMPQDIKNDLLKTFAALKQTVLWKFDSDLPDVPENVHILKWAPQSSILAHPNIKLFITHGGLLSMTETIHHGVPAVGIPLFADQFQNVERAVKKGFAAGVEVTLKLGDDLKVAIEKILTNESYAARAKYLSSVYHDRPMAPADELVYWVEHVVRTGGAPHLRSAALLLPCYSRLYLDLLALLVAALLGLVLLVKWLFNQLQGMKVYVKNKNI